MRLFVAVNGWTWQAQPDIDDAERVVLGIAASEIDEETTAAWLRTFIVPTT